MTKDEALERLLQLISSDNQENSIPPNAKDDEYIIKIELNDNSILFCCEDLTWEEACNKEKEFIKLYGRKDTKTGILSNLTNGGEGTYGHILNEKSKKIISTKLKGRKLNIETCIKMSNSKIGNVPSNKGIKMSDEQKIKIGLSNKNKKKPTIKCLYCDKIRSIRLSYLFKKNIKNQTK